MTVILCTRWTPSTKNTRLGYVDLSLPEVGVTIRGAVVQGTSARRWVSWPAVETGRGYAACFSFMATVDREAWQAAAVAAIDKHIAGLDQEDSGGYPLLMP